MWEVDPRKLKSACEISFNITRPVSVKPLTEKILKRDGNEDRIVWGIYYGVKNGVHQIRIRPNLPMNAANKVLWHELVHADQYENGVDKVPDKKRVTIADKFLEKYSSDEYTEYWNRENEKEARYWSWYFAEKKKLNLLRRKK